VTPLRHFCLTVTEVPSPSADDAPPVRVAIISDTHFPRRGRRLSDEIARRLQGATAIVHGGDLCDLEALAELEAFGRPLHAVLGNNDRGLGDRLPETLTVELGGVRIGVIHDSGPRAGRLARMRRRFPGHDAVIFGHSHIPLHEAAADGFQIFNPGSAADHRGRWPVHTMGELTVVEGVPTFTLIDLEE
jgi:putative phosphoesterase